MIVQWRDMILMFYNWLKSNGITRYAYKRLRRSEQIKLYDTYRLQLATQEINDIYEERGLIQCQQKEN